LRPPALPSLPTRRSSALNVSKSSSCRVHVLTGSPPLSVVYPQYTRYVGCQSSAPPSRDTPMLAYDGGDGGDTGRPGTYQETLTDGLEPVALFPDNLAEKDRFTLEDPTEWDHDLSTTNLSPEDRLFVKFTDPDFQPENDTV